MHDVLFVAEMRALAVDRGWGQAEKLLSTFELEARAEERGALLFYHLGEVQAALARHGAQQPRLEVLISALRCAGFGASRSHVEPKALKTSASLEEMVAVVLGMQEEAGLAQGGAAGQVGVAAGKDTACRIQGS
jgi:tRNA (guanine26-N2/guanine27-N2)-dimethyltransferase